MENAPLTKSDLAWVLIRVIGVVFMCQAIFSIIMVINAAINLSAISAPPLLRNLPAPSPSRTLLGATIIPLLMQSGMAWYFLKDGKFVHNLVMWTKPKAVRPIRKDSSEVKKLPEIPDRVTTLTPTEELEFTAWLDSDSENSKAELDDQIAKFRDFQASKK